jgi:hypothetical protein
MQWMEVQVLPAPLEVPLLVVSVAEVGSPLEMVQGGVMLAPLEMVHRVDVAGWRRWLGAFQWPEVDCQFLLECDQLVWLLLGHVGNG